MVLSQIADMADHGLLFTQRATCRERFEAIKEKLIQQFFSYPRMVETITAPVLQVLHLSRDPIKNTAFSCWLIEWTRKNGWSEKNVPMPSVSGIIFSLGSGSMEFNDNYERYKKGSNLGTSRSVFQCF
jgi:hypothetical protein